MTTPRVNIFGFAVDAVDLAGAVERCEQLIAAGEGAQQTSLNAAKVVSARDDARLREIISSSELVTADGQPVVWAARLLGRPLPERVAGIDLMEALLPLAAERGYGVYILGARPEILEQAVQRLRERSPGLRIVGYRNGYFADADSAAVCAEIRAAQPDILFVAMSSPRKEYWIAQHRHELGVPFAMGVGGAIDVVAGLTQRAPRWLQRAGLEWLYRLSQEPGRLWRRYLTTNTAFMRILVRELVRARLGRA